MDASRRGSRGGTIRLWDRKTGTETPRLDGIRCHVTSRKVSGGTRSDVVRDCRDAFLGLAKTCAKLEIAFWDYLGARLAVPGSHVTRSP
jgi:hypothetical protein